MIRPAAPRDAGVNGDRLIENTAEEPAPKENVSLASLIRRRAPLRYDPARADADHEASVDAARLEKRSVKLAQVAVASPKLPDVEYGPKPKPASLPITTSLPNTALRRVTTFGKAKHRRQLTVRLENARFAHLDQVAKSTGRTFQDILAKAIGRYLDELATDNQSRRARTEDLISKVKQSSLWRRH
jgi:predicted DNA-binding ribbon-helix-helix protein